MLMKILNIIRFAVDEIILTFKQFTLTTILLVLGIIMTGLSIYLYGSYEYDQRICESLLNEGKERTGYILVENFDDEVQKDFIKDIGNIKGIKGVGDIFLDYESVIGEIKLVQKKNTSTSSFWDRITKSKSTPSICINYDALNICDVELMDGVSFEEPEDEYTTYLYLGSGLRDDITIGTTYVNKYKLYEGEELVDIEQKYIVRGYIKKGEKYIASDIEETYFVGDYYYDMDYGVIELTNNSKTSLSENKLFFSIEDGASMKEVLDEINNVSAKYDIHLTSGIIGNSFEKVIESNKKENRHLIELSVIIMISVILIQLCMQSTNIINNTTRYGILYSNGFTKYDVTGVLIIQNVIKFLIALLITSTLVVLYVDFYYKDYFADLIPRILFQIRELVALKTVGISLVVVVLGLIVPLMVIERTSPSKLIKELGD